MPNVLVTGGSGFFGGILKKHLLEKGFFVVNIDLEQDHDIHPNLVSIRGDIADREFVETIFKKHSFTAVFHTAAILAHAVKDTNVLWRSNVDGTRVIADMAAVYKVPRVIFTSSNCLWAKNFGRPVTEDDTPAPIEIYGRSKWEGEKILTGRSEFTSIIFRCPTIMDAGRLGLLSILFEFIDEGRKVWVVGGGNNVYQFIYAQDLVDACMRALRYDKTDIFNIGSDNVKSFRDVYAYVIKRAGSKSRVANFPRQIAIPLMRIAYALRLSPLGPYQYKMIAESFVFDTSKIKRGLAWQPTVTNEEMLHKAYEYYHTHRGEIENRTGVSAHKQSAKMGVIRLLKWLS
jgi:UDP-glucose 4-epimerase